MRGLRRAQADPLGLDGELFKYITHRVQHGEAFVAYKLLGNPMVLHSAVDGLPLACLHLRAATGRGARPQQRATQALVARRPDRGPSDFLGIVGADDQEFELVMTNLTASDLMMFDIGGAPRAREEDFWERTEASFWSGSHRNDRRLNRSNILWPMRPNVCSENHLHFLDHQEHRQLVLRAKSSSPTADIAGLDRSTIGAESCDGYPLFVYPKYGSRIGDKFAKTSWSCPETILVVGAPALLDSDIRDYHNIVVEMPRSDVDIIDEAAASFGVSRERLLQALGIDEALLLELPEDLRRETLVMSLQVADLSALEDESVSTVPSAGPSASALAMGARPAEVAAGRRLPHSGAHNLLIEKFDFERRSAAAVLTLGVRDGIQLYEAGGAAEQLESEDEAQLEKRLDKLVRTRTAELLEDAQSNCQYATKECVVCLESSPPPDTIFYQCGHRCVHKNCVSTRRLPRCPLCRSLIVAILPHMGEDRG